MSQRIIAGVVWIAFAVLAANLLIFVDRHAVNIMFWDSWDYNRAYFDHVSLWEIFRWLHGPHRQGVGGLFIKLVYAFSAWDDHVLGLACAGVIIVAAACALVLKRLVTHRWSLFDIVIPLLFLTLADDEIFVAVSNPAHGPFPVLLAMLIGLALLIESLPWRVFALLVLDLCAMYTGFALFLGVLMPFIFFIYAARSQALSARRAYAAATVVSLAIMGSFFIAYQPAAALACFTFPDPQAWRYLPFAGLVLFSLVGSLSLSALTMFLLALVGVALLAAAAICFFRFARQPSHRNAIELTLVGFTCLFAFNAAVGRVCAGIDAATGSRYLPYTMPAALAGYIALQCRRSLPATMLSVALLLVCIFKLPADRLRAGAMLHMYAEHKAAWRDCYLATESIAQCDAGGFKVFPERRLRICRRSSII